MILFSDSFFWLEWHSWSLIVIINCVECQIIATAQIRRLSFIRFHLYSDFLWFLVNFFVESLVARLLTSELSFFFLFSFVLFLFRWLERLSIHAVSQVLCLTLRGKETRNKSHDNSVLQFRMVYCSSHHPVWLYGYTDVYLSCHLEQRIAAWLGAFFTKGTSFFPIKKKADIFFFLAAISWGSRPSAPRFLRWWWWKSSTCSTPNSTTFAAYSRSIKSVRP